MNSFLSIFINILLFSLISIQLTSSASFPNPPQFPSSNASPDEWALFWKLLHNYYAIIARPRFGKRYDSMLTQLKSSSFLNPTYSSLLSSENDNDYILSENNRNGNDDQQMNIDEFYTFTHPNRRR